ncbi:MAG: hemolysin family protein, partial [Oscillospiraceae bacterium]|nr:hemolysin family protein [Oscillospiraceae bacterium]
KGEEKGIIEPATRLMFENIFEFDDKQVSEIMTHRTDMVAVEDTDTLGEAVAVAIQTGYSRIPVYHEEIDNITGVLYVKDLLRFVCEQVPDSLKIGDIARSEVVFVPRTKKCPQLFAEMTKQKVQLAIIVDEYGGTEGLVTMEDLIEEIVGNIQDEYDQEEEAIKVIDENKFTVDGTTPMTEIEELTDEEFEDGDYDTVAGFLLERLENIPKSDEHPQVIEGGLKFTVLKTEDRRIAEVEIEKL